MCPSRLDEYLEYRVHDAPMSPSGRRASGSANTGPFTSTTAPGNSKPRSPRPIPGITIDERMCESMDIRNDV